MDKSFTSLTSKKGPSRQECSQFVAKFKSAVLMNNEREEINTDSGNDLKTQDKQNTNQQNLTKDGKSTGTTELTIEQMKRQIVHHRIKIDDEYIITIHQAPTFKSRNLRIKTHGGQDNQQKCNKLKEHNEIKDTTAHESGNLQISTVTLLSETTPEETGKPIKNESKTKDDECFDRLLKSDNEMSKPINGPNSDAKEANRCTTLLDPEENSGYHFNNSQQTRRLSPVEEESSECIGSIQIEPNVEISITRISGPKEREDHTAIETEKKEMKDGETTVGENLITFESTPDESSQNQHPKHSLTATMEKATAEQTIENMAQIASCLLRDLATSFDLSLDSHPVTHLKKELGELLQTPSLAGMSSDSLFKVLCNVLEEVKTMRPPASTSATSSSQKTQPESISSDDNIVLLSNNYFIVNMEQIKSMADIMDRINEVVNTLFKHCCNNDIQLTEKEEINSLGENETYECLCSCQKRLQNNSQATRLATNSTESTSTVSEDSESTQIAKGSKESTCKDLGKEYTINVVDMSDVLSMGKNRSNTASNPQSFLSDSLCTNIDSIQSSITEKTNIMRGCAFHFLNSFSQTSCNELGELSYGEQMANVGEEAVRSDESDMLIRRKMVRENTESLANSVLSDAHEMVKLNWEKSQLSDLSGLGKPKKCRFRTSQTLGSESTNTKEELLTLLDKVERLLILNSADRYEMMILLEQIFTEYARSAQKAVADLNKFIVTFNKQKSYL